MAKRIKELRLKNKLTLLEVANALGVSEATAQRYESGEIKNLKYDTIVALANLFNVSPGYLMGWETDEESFSSHEEYYNDPAVAQLAEEMSTKPGLRVLFDASRDLSEDSLKMFAQMIDTFKKTNPDG